LPAGSLALQSMPQTSATPHTPHPMVQQLRRSSSYLHSCLALHGSVPWLYPADIFPLEVRAKGNAWAVAGWSIGNGWLTLLCPNMFTTLNEKTLNIFAIANVITLPMVWALYSESNQRTLEEMDLLFTSQSWWV
jgi:Sugar (and other) transporter